MTLDSGVSNLPGGHVKEEADPIKQEFCSGHPHRLILCTSLQPELVPTPNPCRTSPPK